MPEMVCDGGSVTGALRLVSPPLNTVGVDFLDIVFRNSFSWVFEPSSNLWIRIQSSSDGVTWTDETAWRAVDGMQSNVWVDSHMGGITYVAWTLEGDLPYIFWWAIDDVYFREGIRTRYSLSGDSLQVQWNDVAGATNYSVQCNTVLTGSWTEAASLYATNWPEGSIGTMRLYRVEATLKP